MNITITTNLNEVLHNIVSLRDIFNNDYLLRPAAIELIPIITERIHNKGQGSDGTQIGTYSSEYMKVRTGNFGNSAKVTKGKNKGKLKDAGTTSRGAAKGQARPNYHRSADTKVIVSLTRQLENDWSVLETPKGYGIGFTNSFNADKLGWVEEAKDKVIRELTTEELQYAETRINELITDAFNK